MPKRRSEVPTFAIGFILTLVILVLYFVQWGFLESIELKAFDLRARFDQAQKAPPDVAIVSIGDDSIAKIGGWPWPRSRIARMIDLLSKSGARVIGADILFSEAEENQGLRDIQKLKEVFLSRILKPSPTKEKAKFLRDLTEADQRYQRGNELVKDIRVALGFLG